MISNKYGFDYFSSRVEVLTEMARPSPLVGLGEAGIKLKELLDSVMRTMRSGNIENSNGELVPGLPSNLATNRTLRYMIHMLGGLDRDTDPLEGDEGDFSGNRSKDEIILTSQKILGLSTSEPWKKQGFADVDKLFRATLLHSAKHNQEMILSPDFQERVLNPQNIADNMQEKRVANTSMSINKAKEQEQLHGDTIENIHGAETGIKDVLKKIHRAMAAKAARKNPESKTGIVNSYTNNIDVILKTLEDLSVFKNILDKITNLKVDMGTEDNDNRDIIRKVMQFNEILENPLTDEEITSLAVLPRDKTGNTILEDLLEQFSDLKDDGISMEAFESEISDIMSYTPEEIHPVLHLLVKEVAPKNTESEFSEYPAYPSDVLKQFIVSPELKQGFDRYYKWYTKNLELKIEKTKEKLEYAKSGLDDYSGMLPELRRNYAAFLERWRESNIKKKKDYANSLRDDDDVLSKFGLTSDDIGEDPMASKIAKAKAMNQESYVLSYMEEQISKDKFKPRGEFKERGFKKPTNYWQGRNL